MHSNEKASSNLCRSRWCSLDIYRGFVRFIRTVERPCWRKNEREEENWPVWCSWTTEPVAAGSGGISVDDWKHARKGRTIVLLLFFLSFAIRPVELFALRGEKLSPMGFLPAIPRRIVFFSVFCCGLLFASARSLSPRRRIVSPSLDTFVHRFDMFDAERANEKHRRSEIGRDFPSEAQRCCWVEDALCVLREPVIWFFLPRHFLLFLDVKGSERNFNLFKAWSCFNEIWCSLY